MKQWLFIILLGILGVTTSANLVLAQEVRRDLLLSPPTQSELQELSGKPTNRINIPGLSYSDIQQVEEGDGIYLYIPFLGEYIAAMYRYLVVLASLAAVIVIIISGIQWTASAGNSSTIDSAKKRITGAITGLGLAVGSYVILYSINPELVAFRSLKLKYVEGREVAGDHGDFESLGLSEGDFQIDGSKRTTLNAANCPEVQANIRKYISYKPKKGEKNPIYQYTKDAELCRRKCLEELPPEKRSKASGSGTDGDRDIGHIDCGSVKGTRNLSDITYVGIHEGRFGGGTAHWWLQYLGKGDAFAFGTHYFIDRDGTIKQVADERFIVWHGVYNSKGIGIDLNAGCSSGSGSAAVSKTCNYTAAQYASLKKLITEITSRTNVVFDDEHIRGHCQQSKNPNSGHIDPRNFDWTKIGLSNEKHRGVRCLYAL